MDSLDFSKYISIMNEDTSKNEEVNSIVNSLYNSVLFKINIDNLENMDKSSADIATELTKINPKPTNKIAVGNLYDFIHANAPTNVLGLDNNYVLSQYTFTPKLIYNKYINTGDSGFNTIRQASKAYDRVSQTIINSYRNKMTGVFDDMFKSMEDHSGDISVIPNRFMIGAGVSEYVFDSKLDKVLISTLNGSLFSISEMSINTFFRKLANLNYYIINERITEFKKKIADEVKCEFGELRKAVSEYGSLRNKNTVDDYFENIKNSLGDLFDSLVDFIKYHNIKVLEIYPGMYLHETFSVLHKIMNSSDFTFDTVENINMYTIYYVCQNFFKDTSRGRYTEFLRLQNSAKEFNKMYNDIRKEIIKDGRFKYTLIDSSDIS